MEWLEVLRRIGKGEDSHTEFKRGVELRKEIGPAIAAFANSDGGVLVLGVDDKSREIVGIRESPESVAERVTNFLQSGLGYPVQARIDRHEDPRGWVHWIEVPRQRGFEPVKHGGRVYVRRGRASVEPSPSELQDLYNTFGYVLTEEQAIGGTSPSDVDLEAFERFLVRMGARLDEAPTLDVELDLRNRGVVVERGGGFQVTLYGLLAFGRRPQGHAQTLSLWVDCVAYAGRDQAAPVLQSAEAKGRIDEQIDRALGWFRSVGRRERYGSVVREDVPPVPEAALREALVNAVCHRDYAISGSRVLFEVFDDRVVVTSPGRLPNTLTPASVKAGGRPRSRNELMANFMQTMGYMEGRGRGWPRIRHAMRQHNGLEPILDEDREARWVVVTLPIAVDRERTDTNGAETGDTAA